MQVFRFHEFVLKTPIRAPKLGVFRGTPKELVLTFGGLNVCVQFGENQQRNATVRVSTDGHTHARTQNDFINCPMLYAIAMGQIKATTVLVIIIRELPLC